MSIPFRHKLLAVTGAALVATAAASSTHAATFFGSDLRVTEEFFGMATTVTDVTVGDGVELANYGDILDFDFDIDDMGIDIVAAREIPAAGGTFGFGFEDITGGIADFQAVSIGFQTGYGGFSSDNVTVTGDRLSVNFGGAMIEAGDRVRFDVAFDEDGMSVVPLPATAPLALGAFALLGMVGRRRQGLGRRG